MEVAYYLLLRTYIQKIKDEHMNITPEQIKSGRERRQITQAELAKELGVSLRTVTSWEAGDSVPRNRTASIIDALNLDVKGPATTYEWGEEAVRTRVGQLAKQRREELGLSREAFARRAGLRSKQTVSNFEFARSMPRGQTLRQIEKVLEWKNNSIDDALEAGSRAGELFMEDFDKYDRDPDAERPLESFSTEEILSEAIRRLSELKGALGPSNGVTIPKGAQFLYGLAANTDPSHLERMAEEEDKD